MTLNTVIFDMDGLLIDSEPYWQEAGAEALEQYDVILTREQYHDTTGLRTKEWLDHWFRHFGIGKEHATRAEDLIHELAIEKIRAKGMTMPGVETILSFFQSRKFRIGLATSSPIPLVDVVVEKLGIRHYLQAIASAGDLPYGKPHPQVYLDCAALLGASPLECLCFEDSFNGMIAAKAARMQCVVVPSPDQYELTKWGAADLKLRSLEEFSASGFLD